MIANDYNYPDDCIISRSTGKADVKGNEISTALYSGVCEIQYGSSGNTTLQVVDFQSKPVLFIPDSSILFKVNDMVTVTSANGRKSTFTIDQFESAPDFGDTEIWLKGGVDV